MSRRRKRTNFEESAMLNNRTYQHYYSRLKELAISMFDWKNVPKTLDIRYLELALFERGQAVFFKDEELGFLCLNCSSINGLNVYGIPTKRRAFASNGYNRDLSDKDSVIIFNNYLHTNSHGDISMYAGRLYELQRTMDVNVKAQKTPVLVQGTPEQKLTLANLYKEYDGNAPVIYADKNLDLNSLKVLKTDAPYVADRVNQLKTEVWNEALTYLGISNVNIQKRERLITDEVTRNQGGIIASRYSRLETRRKAAEEINTMFGLNIEVDYHEDFQQVDFYMDESELGAETTGGNDNE